VIFTRVCLRLTCILLVTLLSGPPLALRIRYPPQREPSPEESFRVSRPSYRHIVLLKHENISHCFRFGCGDLSALTINSWHLVFLRVLWLSGACLGTMFFRVFTPPLDHCELPVSAAQSVSLARTSLTF